VERDAKEKDKHPLTPAPYRIKTKTEESEKKRKVPDLGGAKILFPSAIYPFLFRAYAALLGIG
jgi:hypothetical protein